MTLLFHTFLDSGSSVFNSLTSVRLTFGGFSGILSSTEAPLPLWVVPWATSCVGAQFVSWPWWEPGLCILSVSLLTAASNFSKSSSSFTWVFCRQGFISILMLEFCSPVNNECRNTHCTSQESYFKSDPASQEARSTFCLMSGRWTKKS